MSRKSSRLLPILSLCLVICMSISSMAAFIPPEGTVDPQDATYAYFWEYEKEFLRKAKGDWQEGPTATGPYVLTKEISHQYSNEYTGSVGGSLADLNFALGLNIGKVRSETVSGSLNIPEGKCWTILTRSKFDVYSITCTRIRLTVATGQRTVIETRIIDEAFEHTGVEFGYRDEATGKITPNN